MSYGKKLLISKSRRSTSVVLKSQVYYIYQSSFSFFSLSPSHLENQNSKNRIKLSQKEL